MARDCTLQLQMLLKEMEEVEPLNGKTSYVCELGDKMSVLPKSTDSVWSNNVFNAEIGKTHSEIHMEFPGTSNSQNSV